MMNDRDIRWQQRFASYQKALRKLREAVELIAQRELSRLEKQGVIQAFEFTHELAWNLLKDYLQDQGNQQIRGRGMPPARRSGWRSSLTVRDGWR